MGAMASHWPCVSTRCAPFERFLAKFDWWLFAAYAIFGCQCVPHIFGLLQLPILVTRAFVGLRLQLSHLRCSRLSSRFWPFLRKVALASCLRRCTEGACPEGSFFDIVWLNRNT